MTYRKWNSRKEESTPTKPDGMALDAVRRKEKERNTA